jgi:protocatechuate 3,4-dioxygenase beta subunit
VQISVSSPELGRDTRTSSTDADGRYEVKDLPAGRYTITVRRGGYLTLRYGQRRPFEQGQPLEIGEGQTIEHVDFTLPKASLITGRVTDEFGDSVEGAMVLAMRSMYLNGRRRFVPVGVMSRTDDAGGYRISGLSPGTYVVSARLNDKWTTTVGGREETMGYAPSYFPGTTNVVDARKLTVGVGQEAAAIDFSLVPGRAARISGTAIDSRGRPLKNVNVGQEIRGPDFGSFSSAGRATVASDGTFSIPNVPPGDYVLSAENGIGSTDSPEVALLAIVVDGADADNLVLTGSAGGTISGQILTDGGTLPKAPPLRIQVIEPGIGQPSPVLLGAFRGADSGAPGFAQVTDNGTFTVQHVFGRARFNVTAPTGWAVKAILHNGEDITDSLIELKSGEEWSSVQVVLSDRFGSVTDRLVDEKGQPLADATMIVFSADSAKWFDGSRFVRAARPDQQGQSQIKGLPPGDYFAVAVDYVEEGGWYDPDYLASIRPYAEPVTLTEAQDRILTLKVVTLK